MVVAVVVMLGEGNVLKHKCSNILILGKKGVEKNFNKYPTRIANWILIIIIANKRNKKSI